MLGARSFTSSRETGSVPRGAAAEPRGQLRRRHCARPAPGTALTATVPEFAPTACSSCYEEYGAGEPHRLHPRHRETVDPLARGGRRAGETQAHDHLRPPRILAEQEASAVRNGRAPADRRRGRADRRARGGTGDRDRAQPRRRDRGRPCPPLPGPHSRARAAGGRGLSLSDGVRRWIAAADEALYAAAETDMDLVGKTVLAGVAGDEAWRRSRAVGTSSRPTARRSSPRARYWPPRRDRREQARSPSRRCSSAGRTPRRSSRRRRAAAAILRPGSSGSRERGAHHQSRPPRGARLRRGGSSRVESARAGALPTPDCLHLSCRLAGGQSDARLGLLGAARSSSVMLAGRVDLEADHLHAPAVDSGLIFAR